MTRLPQIDLAVAALDLQLVRLLRSAMAPKVRAVSTVCPPPRPVVVQRLTPEALAVRQVPSPARPALVLYRTVVQVVPAAAPASPEAAPGPDKSSAVPLPPPWKRPVWEQPVEPPPQIKVVINRPDIISKGSLIDFFM